jgi:hypothetical protein
MFQLKHLMLPHQGVMPGARGHKKVVVPAGTKVYCIVHGTLMYWAVYLDEAQARHALEGLEATASGRARRNIQLDTLLQWNFTSQFPKRVVRPLGGRT